MEKLIEIILMALQMEQYLSGMSIFAKVVKQMKLPMLRFLLNGAR